MCVCVCVLAGVRGERVGICTFVGPLGVMLCVVMMVFPEAVLEPSLSKQVGLCVCVCVCVCVVGGGVESRSVHMCGAAWCDVCGDDGVS